MTMKRIDVTLRTVDCPKCQSGPVKIRITGLVYADGRMENLVRRAEHTLCYYSDIGPAQPEEIAAARAILFPPARPILPASESTETPHITVDPEKIQPRDPSTSEQAWHGFGDHDPGGVLEDHAQHYDE